MTALARSLALGGVAAAFLVLAVVAQLVALR